MAETLLTVAQAAARLNVSKPTVYRRIWEGSLPAVRGDAVGPLRIVESELERWLFRPQSPGGMAAAGSRQAGVSPFARGDAPPPNPATSATVPSTVATGPDERAAAPASLRERASGRKERR
jgi:excisionase family DNA binding protein